MIVEVQGKPYHFSFVTVSSFPHFWGHGTTCVNVTRMDDGHMVFGPIAYCSSSDRFDQRKGEQEALKKFMALMPWGKEDRRKVWAVWRATIPPF